MCLGSTSDSETGRESKVSACWALGGAGYAIFAKDSRDSDGFGLPDWGTTHLPAISDWTKGTDNSRFLPRLQSPVSGIGGRGLGPLSLGFIPRRERHEAWVGPKGGGRGGPEPPFTISLAAVNNTGEISGGRTVSPGGVQLRLRPGGSEFARVHASPTGRDGCEGCWDRRRGARRSQGRCACTRSRNSGPRCPSQNISLGQEPESWSRKTVQKASLPWPTLVSGCCRETLTATSTDKSLGMSRRSSYVWS